MPFTLSHAAATLPFRRTGLAMSAVVTGSFAPDFEYFLGHHGAFGHKMPGIVIFDVPLAFVALWLFHHFAKEPLAACLPQGTRERLDLGPKSLSLDSLSRFAIIAASIMIGIGTHILWDSFTHPGYWLTRNWHFLSESIVVPPFGRRTWYEIFQYISSVFGILVVLLWYIHWYRNTQPSPSPTSRRSPTSDRFSIASAFVLALAAGLIRGLIGGVPDGVHGLQRFMTEAIITGLDTFWIGIVLYGIIRNWNESRRRTA